VLLVPLELLASVLELRAVMVVLRVVLLELLAAVPPSSDRRRPS
jgi:hypothetical protein